MAKDVKFMGPFRINSKLDNKKLDGFKCSLLAGVVVGGGAVGMTLGPSAEEAEELVGIVSLIPALMKDSHLKTTEIYKHNGEAMIIHNLLS